MMENYWSVFDIIGLIMIGFFSLYMVGVVVIGWVVCQVFGQMLVWVMVYYYELFVQIYQGYGIDYVIVVGFL